MTNCTFYFSDLKLYSGSDDNKISGNTFYNGSITGSWWWGSESKYAKFNVISHNNIVNGSISLHYSNDSVVCFNTVLNSQQDGISFSGSNNTVCSNTILNANGDGIEFYYSDSGNNKIQNNMLDDCDEYAISLMSSDGNEISNNSLTNSYQGMHFYSSDENLIFGNLLDRN